MKVCTVLCTNTSKIETFLINKLSTSTETHQKLPTKVRGQIDPIDCHLADTPHNFMEKVGS